MNMKPKAMTIDIVDCEERCLRLLSGPPESFSMRSGLVTLQPGESVGRHSTGTFEELVIVLEGEGEMVLRDRRILALSPRTAAYCPPDTGHDVINRGREVMRYIYVVARAECE